MTGNLRSRVLRRFMERGDERRIHPQHREKVRDILVRLNASAAPDDMDLPGFRLHPLRGGVCRVLGGDSARQLAGDFPVRGRPRR
ncbi:MAG: hypothetical protein OXD40_07060 [bacterium]|nr:hypothetical protein [bacterium]